MVSESAKNKPISVEGLDVFKTKIEEKILSASEALNQTANEAKLKADSALSVALASKGVNYPFTISSGGWKASVSPIHGDFKYEAEISISGITEDANADVAFDIDSIDACAAAGVSSVCVIEAGTIKVFSKDEVGQEVSGNVYYANNSSGNGNGRTNVQITYKKHVPKFGGWYNANLEDDNHDVSTMVRIPKMSWKDLGIGDSDELFPAFVMSNGVEVDALYVGKYLGNDKGSSTKGITPKTSITIDDAHALCSGKGEGWHCQTQLEHMAVALWSAKHGTQPQSSSGATGSGKLNSTHNGKENGIYDMHNTSYYEWSIGVRLVQGEVQVISKDGVTFGNDAAVVDSSASSPYWYAIDGTNGNLIKPNGNGTTENSVKATSSGWGLTGAANYSATINAVVAKEGVCEEAQHKLMALGFLLPPNVKSDFDESVYFYKGDEYVGCVGYYGAFYAYWYYGRSHSRSFYGFRPAFCSLKTV